MRQCFKNIPAKFQSRPMFLAGFFSKIVTDDDDRRKTFFLASCSEYSSLNYRVVTMEYRTGDRGSACTSALRELSFCSCRPANSLIKFFIALLELRTFVPDHRACLKVSGYKVIGRARGDLWAKFAPNVQV